MKKNITIEQYGTIEGGTLPRRSILLSLATWWVRNYGNTNWRYQLKKSTAVALQ
jgi:hypothetical protein